MKTIETTNIEKLHKFYNSLNSTKFVIIHKDVNPAIYPYLAQFTVKYGNGTAYLHGTGSLTSIGLTTNNIPIIRTAGYGYNKKNALFEELYYRFGTNKEDAKIMGSGRIEKYFSDLGYWIIEV